MADIVDDPKLAVRQHAMDVFADRPRRDQIVTALKDQAGRGQLPQLGPVVRQERHPGKLLGDLGIGTAKAVGQFDLGPAAAFSIIYFLMILLLCWVFYTSVVRRKNVVEP